VLAERALCLAVPASHPLARQNAADLADLRGQRWIASPSAADETLMGVWPGLDERPQITHTARDWLTKLHLVAAGCGVTSVPGSFAAIAPRACGSWPCAAGRRNNGASSWPGSRTRSPSQPPASPTPCAPQPTSRRRVNHTATHRHTPGSSSSSPGPAAKAHPRRRQRPRSADIARQAVQNKTTSTAERICCGVLHQGMTPTTLRGITDRYQTADEAACTWPRPAAVRRCCSCTVTRSTGTPGGTSSRNSQKTTASTPSACAAPES